MAEPLSFLLSRLLTGDAIQQAIKRDRTARRQEAEITSCMTGMGRWWDSSAPELPIPKYNRFESETLLVCKMMSKSVHWLAVNRSYIASEMRLPWLISPLFQLSTMTTPSVSPFGV
jgi:hypothetical protein